LKGSSGRGKGFWVGTASQSHPQHLEACFRWYSQTPRTPRFKEAIAPVFPLFIRHQSFKIFSPETKRQQNELNLRSAELKEATPQGVKEF
jgi:hypothetical protein